MGGECSCEYEACYAGGMADKAASGTNPTVATTNPTAADVKTLPKAKEDEGFDYVLDAMNGVVNRHWLCCLSHGVSSLVSGATHRVRETCGLRLAQSHLCCVAS